METMKTINYHFALKNGEEFSFDIPVFARPEDAILEAQQHDKALWTHLDFHRCEGCRYYKSEYCPVAVKLQAPAAIFSHVLSHERAQITVTTPERTYSKDTDVQEGLASMLGLIMATSDCPTTRAYFPAAWFHLPFASFEETLFRITSVWMLKQFFTTSPHKDYSIILESIKKQCTEAHNVNIGIFKRLKESGIGSKDAPFNAVSILNAFASLMPMSLDDKLEELSELFARHP